MNLIRKRNETSFIFIIFIAFSVILDIISYVTHFTNIGISISRNSKNVFAEPYLFPKEKEIFYEYLDHAKIYFEYGSSGMIHQAAKRGLTIYSAEVGPAWVTYLMKEIEQINRVLNKKVNITYLYSDLQTDEKPTQENLKKYVSIYNHQKYNADLIYINGKYHASCALNIYNQIDTTPIIIIREIDKRMKNIVKKYYDQMFKVGRTIILRKKSKLPILTKEDIKKVEEIDFNSSSKSTRIVSYLRSLFNETIQHYINYNNEQMMIKPSKKQVWFLWWQGMENAPPIVKLCLAAVKKNLPDGIVTVITNETLEKIIDIPSYVIEKVNDKNISFTHFSDILRVTLISRFGGLWIDATIITAQKIPSEIFDMPFYTVHFDDTYKYVTGKWVGFCQASYINNVVPKFASDFFLQFVKQYKIFDYFLLDFIMLLGYEYIPSFKRMIESVPFNNPAVLTMMEHINNKYVPANYEYLTKDTIFFKSSWKIRVLPEIDGYQTIFGYYVSKYIGNDTSNYTV